MVAPCSVTVLLPDGPVNDAAWSGGRVSTVLQHRHAVDQDVHHPCGELMRLLVGGVVLNPGGIKNRDVGVVARCESPPLARLTSTVRPPGAGTRNPRATRTKTQASTTDANSDRHASTDSAVAITPRSPGTVAQYTPSSTTSYFAR